MKRAFILVLDSFGIGAAADAEQFGDVGSDTLGHIADQCEQGLADNDQRKGALRLPNLSKLGLAMAYKESTGRFAPGTRRRCRNHWCVRSRSRAFFR